MNDPVVYDRPNMPGVAYIVPIVDLANPLIEVNEVKIEVCIVSDLNCTDPITAGLPPIANPDPARKSVWQINLPYGFEGYLQLSAPGYLTTTYHFGGPIIGNLQNPEQPQVLMGENIQMPREASIDEFFSLLSLDARDPATGILALRVMDCFNRRSADVKLDLLTADPNAFGWTLINNQPVTDAEPVETDSRGVAGFASIRAPVTARVEGMLPDGRRYGSNGWAVRPNQLTAGEIRTDYEYGR